MSKSLIITVGLPRSGKSTWAKGYTYPIVSTDSIRLAIYEQPYIKSAEPYIWAIAQTMVKSLFLAGHDAIILDATNTTKERRKIWISDSWNTFYKEFTTPKSECIKRAIDSNQEYLINVIENMYNKFEEINEKEEKLKCFPLT